MPSPSIVLLRTQSDARLVSLAREGHERAFEAIVERYRRQLLRSCRRVLPEARAEDALQQALVAAWRGLERGDEVRELRPWLHRIAHNTSLNLLRESGYDYDELQESLRIADAHRGRARAAGRGAPDPPRARGPARAPARGAAGDRRRGPQPGRGRRASSGSPTGAVRQLVHRARTELRTAATASCRCRWPAGWPPPGPGGTSPAASPSSRRARGSAPRDAREGRGGGRARGGRRGRARAGGEPRRRGPGPAGVAAAATPGAARQAAAAAPRRTGRRHASRRRRSARPSAPRRKAEPPPPPPPRPADQHPPRRGATATVGRRRVVRRRPRALGGDEDGRAGRRPAGPATAARDRPGNHARSGDSLRQQPAQRLLGLGLGLGARRRRDDGLRPMPSPAPSATARPSPTAAARARAAAKRPTATDPRTGVT